VGCKFLHPIRPSCDKNGRDAFLDVRAVPLAKARAIRLIIEVLRVLGALRLVALALGLELLAAVYWLDDSGVWALQLEVLPYAILPASQEVRDHLMRATEQARVRFPRISLPGHAARVLALSQRHRGRGWLPGSAAGRIGTLGLTRGCWLGGSQASVRCSASVHCARQILRTVSRGKKTWIRRNDERLR
jgi:hypothetical protein